MESPEIVSLKGKRASTQATFTRRANKMSLGVDIFEKGALIEEMRAISADFDRAHDAASTLLEALAEIDGGEEEAGKTNDRIGQMFTVFREAFQLARDTLWTKFASSEIQQHVDGTEEKCKEVEAISFDDMTENDFDSHREGLWETIHDFEQKVLAWERIVSDKVNPHKQLLYKFRSRVRDWELRWKKSSRTPKPEPSAAGMQQTSNQSSVQISLDQHSTSASNQPSAPAAPPSQSLPTILKPQISLERTRLPIFSGNMTDYYQWKAEWTELETLGNPLRTAGVTRFHLLASLTEKVKRDLVLSSCVTVEEMVKRLDHRFGNKAKIVLKIAEEVESLPAVRGNNPRKTIELIQAVERALSNLVILGEEDIVKNRLVAQSLERKLPSSLKEKWIEFKAEPLNEVTPQNHFDSLLLFLQKHEAILEELDQLDEGLGESNPPAKTPVDKGAKKAFSKATSGQRGSSSRPQSDSCTACSETQHAGRLYACATFRGMSIQAKRAHLNAHKLCSECLCFHAQSACNNRKFVCTKADCRSEELHHYLLCPKAIPVEEAKSKASSKVLGLTTHQEELLAKVAPELRDEFRKAFSNKASAVTCSAGKAPEEYPVVMMLLDVTTNAGQLIGTLIDLASDTNYITHSAARRLGLNGESIQLMVHGVGGMTKKVSTKRYSLRLRVKTAKGEIAEHKVVCYGLDSIAEVCHPVTPEQLQKIFPGVSLTDLTRPSTIDLLISHREGRLVPQPSKREGDLVLWDGPLGVTVAGTHPNLFESVDLTLLQSETHFARTMRTSSELYKEVILGTEDLDGDVAQAVTLSSTNEVLDWFKWDSIGAACEPKCGGCRCGRCSPGGQEMTLGEERELEKIKNCLSYVLADKHSVSPHWDAAYPWKVNPEILPDNRKAVEATFRKAEERLAKEPLWKAAYAEQIHEMVTRGAAVKFTRQQIKDWNGPVWYISHLVAPNPHSSSTPVRIVWNSSQEFKGMSLNNMLHKGPDVLNPIRGVLLRFRSGLYAALGDVKKMYNSVWLKDEEVHLHRFLWRDDPKEEIGEYAVVRVNIGDKPAGCIAQVALRETANLPQFATMLAERRILTEDCYVDDILTSHDDLQALIKMTKRVEEILQAGGFLLKPWVLTGQSGRGEDPTSSCDHRTAEPKMLILPNQMQDEENKALGVGYEPETDNLHLLTSVNFSKRRGKMRTGLDLQEKEVREGTPDPLTRRMLLSQIAGFYDPIGLASPIKQRGVMLVRQSFQEAGKDRPAKDTWDEPLPQHLREAAITLFEQCVRLSQVKFARSLTPHGALGRPMGITFSDGSEASYGAVLYLRWETVEGKVVVKLVESKAKLTPLDQKGDVIKAELCGAVFATRLKTYFEKHCHIQVDRWIHFVDSQTILAAIQKDSYGYQTFFANRIGEIQKAGSVDNWRWVEGKENIADLITRGSTPEDLAEGSAWQEGPGFLKLPFESWPVKTAREILPSVSEEIGGLQRKAFSAAVIAAEDQTFKWSSPSIVALVKLVKPERISSLTRLCGSIGWLKRAVDFWLRRPSRTPGCSKWEESTYLSAEERAVAFKFLALEAQDGIKFQDTTLDRLVVQRDDVTGLFICGGRVQSWDEDKIAVPLIPYQSWLATLLVREAHEENHEGVAATLLRTRKKAWITQGRRLVKKILNDCITCIKRRAQLCQQVMSDLPPERTQRASPFEFTTLDLFGPFEVKDSVKRRTTKKVWGIVYCCMASRAVHADLTDDQSAESFLQAYSRFVALRGHPRKLWSDRGTNFIGAKPALLQLYKYLDCLQALPIETVAAKNGTEWKWEFHPADAPHRNGAAEAAVKLLKRALMSLGGTTGSLTWGELQTLLYQAANLTNERPIDARAQEQENSIEYLTPNSLILGRASPGGDTSSLDLETHSWRRLRAIQIGVDRFWAKWRELAGPNLFIRQKWHRSERNVQVGDLVWVADPNALRSQFRLGRILSVYPDNKGVVRDADITTCAGTPASQAGYRKKSCSPMPTVVIRRDVRRLVVLLPVED